MGDEYPFYGGTPPHVRHSTTSRAAAEKAEPKTKTQRQRVYGFLQSCLSAGATDEQIQDALALNPSTQRPRRVELVQAGKVKDSGRRAKTRSGRAAVLWIVETLEPRQTTLFGG